MCCLHSLHRCGLQLSWVHKEKNPQFSLYFCRSRLSISTKLQPKAGWYLYPQTRWGEATTGCCIQSLVSASFDTDIKTFSLNAFMLVLLAVVQKCFFFIKAPLNPFPSLSHHLVARVYESKAEFRSALQHEKEGYTIYKNQVTSLRAANLCHQRAVPLRNCAPAWTSGRPFLQTALSRCQGIFFLGMGQNCCPAQELSEQPSCKFSFAVLLFWTEAPVVARR